MPTRSDFSNHTIFLHFCEHSFLLIPSGMDIECNKINHHHQSSSLGWLITRARGLFLDTLESGVEEACTPGFATFSSGAQLDETL